MSKIMGQGQESLEPRWDFVLSVASYPPVFPSLPHIQKKKKSIGKRLQKSPISLGK